MSSGLPRESVQSTPVSVGGMSWAFSDIESVVSLSDHRLDAGATVAVSSKLAPVHPEFAFPDGNIEIQAMDQSFWVHEYHLNKFTVFAALIQAAKNSETVRNPSGRLILVCDQKTKGEDIYNTLKVVYASHIDGVPDFDSNIMTSTLRIASAFDYSGLREFAISKLEGMKLPAVQRIKLCDEFSLPTWETPAFTELCSRKEPITAEEANILGITRFVEIARIREAERTRWATNLFRGDVLQILNSSSRPENSPDADSAPNDFEYSSGRSALPTCNCRANGPYGPVTVQRCSVHSVAPQILTEGEALLKRRDELLEQLNNIQSAVNRSFERGDFPSSSDMPSIETELSKLPWVHRVC